MKKRIRLQGFLIFLSVFLLIIFRGYLFQGERQRIACGYLDVLGLFLVLSGFLLRISARGYKAELNPDGKTLVTAGPYALMRNPMYFGTLLIGLGVTLSLLRWQVAIIFLAVYLLIYIPQIKREEKKLAGYFPDKFSAYCKSVPRFFPSLSGALRVYSAKYLRIKKGWLKKEIASLFWTLIFLFALGAAQDLRLIGQINPKKEFLKILLVCGFFLRCRMIKA